MDIDPIKLLGFAKVATDLFLKEGVALNKAIAKLAEANELNPFQIQRVAEEANHAVQASLYKSSEDKTFTFEMADPELIVKEIRGPGLSKVAYVDILTASLTPVESRDREWLDTELSSIHDPELGSRNARDARFLLQKTAQHISKFQEELTARRVEAQEAIEETLAKVAQSAKDHILLEGGKLSDFFKYACLRDPEFAEGYKVVFEAIRENLMKLGAPIDRNLIADQLEMPGSTLDVINGAHTLAIDLDTLKNKISQDDLMAKRLRLLDTFGDAVVDKIRDLRTVEDMDQSILSDIWDLSKKAEAGPDSFCDGLEKEGWVGKALLALLGLGALGTAGKFVRHAAKGATKEVGKRRDEEAQLRQLTHGGYRFAY